VRIELFGVARLRAGTDLIEVEAGNLAAALHALAEAYPTLVPEVIAAGRLTESYVANLNGHTFLSDGGTRLAQDDTLLILGAHAGG